MSVIGGRSERMIWCPRLLNRFGPIIKRDIIRGGAGAERGRGGGPPGGGPCPGADPARGRPRAVLIESLRKRNSVCIIRLVLLARLHGAASGPGPGCRLGEPQARSAANLTVPSVSITPHDAWITGPKRTTSPKATYSQRPIQMS